MNEVDCWHYLHNMWIGAIVLKLGQHLAEVLSNDLEAILFMLRVTTDVTNLGRATEKYFGLQANYVKVQFYPHFFVFRYRCDFSLMPASKSFSAPSI